MKHHHKRLASAAALGLLLLAGAQARTWTSVDGTKTFEGELRSYDLAAGKVIVTLTDAQLAVDGKKNKEFKGNVATVYANPLCHGGGGNSHYDGNAETYMDVGEEMGRAMVGLLKQ